MLLLEDRTKQCARLTAPSFPRRRGRFRLPSTERAPLIDGSRKRPLRSTTNLNNEPGSWAARGTSGACCHLPLRTNDRRQAATRADAEVQARFPAPKARSQPRRHLMRSAAAMRKPSSNPTVASARGMVRPAGCVGASDRKPRPWQKGRQPWSSHHRRKFVSSQSRLGHSGRLGH